MMKRSTTSLCLVGFMIFSAIGQVSLNAEDDPLLAQLDMADDTVDKPIAPSPKGRVLRWPTTTSEGTEVIRLIKETSAVVRLDRKVKRIALSNPEIADVLLLGPDEMLIYAKETGSLNLILWDEKDEQATFNLESSIDVKKMLDVLKQVDSNADVEVMPFMKRTFIYGFAETSAQVKKIEDAAKAVDDKVVSFVRVKEPKQILLEVRFAEIDRQSSENFGFDAESLTRWFSVSSFSGQNAAYPTTANPFTPRGAALGSDLLSRPDPAETNLFFNYATNSGIIQNYIEWLEQRNVLKLIARPNLLAKDGEEASFVVGGETPYITTTTTSVNVEYKEFGTKLTFTPEVLEGGMLRLKMDMQVSELDFANTISLQGTDAPSIIKTQHKTVAELRNKESLVIGGLLSQRINKIDRKVPVLGDIPVISKLFKKTTFSRKDIEQVIVVTPHVVEPFDLKQDRKLFPPEMVARATETYTPVAPDTHADTVHVLLTQNESYAKFDDEQLKRADQVVKDAANKVVELDEIKAAVVDDTPYNMIEQKKKIQPAPKSFEDLLRELNDLDVQSVSSESSSSSSSPSSQVSTPVPAA